MQRKPLYFTQQPFGRFLTLFAIILGCAGQLFAASNSLDYRPFPAAWQSQLDAFTSSGKIPGALMLIKSPEWGIRVGVTGKANLETGTPLHPDMHFRIGSCTKVYTSMVILQMEQEGLLRLDDTVDQYLTGEYELKLNANKITIRDCLQHTSGLTNYLDAPFFATYPDPDGDHTSPISPKFIMDTINQMNLAPNAPYFNPGAVHANSYGVLTDMIYGVTVDPAKVVTQPQTYPPTVPMWWYTNSGYHILGLIIEKVSGRTIDQEIKTRITDKIGLSDTFFALDEKYPEDIVHGYTKLDVLLKPKYDQWIDVTDTNPSYAWAAGAVVSTPWDMMRFCEALFTEESLINRGTRAKMMRFADARLKWPDTEYGVGALIQNHQSFGDLRGHGGAFKGYHNLMEFAYDNETFFVVVINTWDSDYEVQVMEAVMPLVLGSVTDPQPATGGSATLGDGNSISLRWNPNRDYGDSYEIYMGTDADKVDNATVATTDVKWSLTDKTSATVTGLLPKTTYYWRVDAKSSTGDAVHGPLWSFATQTGSTPVNAWQIQ